MEISSKRCKKLDRSFLDDRREFDRRWCKRAEEHPARYRHAWVDCARARDGSSAATIAFVNIANSRWFLRNQFHSAMQILADGRDGGPVQILQDRPYVDRTFYAVYDMVELSTGRPRIDDGYSHFRFSRESLAVVPWRTALPPFPSQSQKAKSFKFLRLMYCFSQFTFYVLNTICRTEPSSNQC